jgi:DNA-nicking Smr family endonuclease
MANLDVRPVSSPARRLPVRTGPAAGDAPRPLDPSRPRGPDDDRPRATTDEPLPVEPELAELLGRVRAVAARNRRQPPARGPVLDLHGFSEADALHEVRAFIERHREGAERTLRIITGKGGPDAVLRPAVERFLRASSAVASLRSGRADEGAEGVLVATLRRRSPPRP